MNKNRRNRIDKACKLLQEAEDILGECSEEELDYANNMPENLQMSEKHDRAEELAGIIEEGADECGSILQNMEELIP